MKFESNVDDFHKEQQAINNVNTDNARIVDQICSLTRCLLDGAICKDEHSDQIVLLLVNNRRM